LDITRVEPKATGQAVGDDVHDQVGGLFGVVLSEEEAVVQAVGNGRLAGVDAVGVGDHPAVLGLAEHVGQPHLG
jgi:hypothetical protein